MDTYNAEYYKVRAYEIDNLREHFNLLAVYIEAQLKPRITLDIGCAKGYFVEALRDRGIEAFGCDISEYALKHSSYKVARYLYWADAEEFLPFRSETVDTITCMECLEHLNHPWVAVFEMSRLLKSGGYVVTSSPQITPWRIIYNVIFGQAEVHPSELPLWDWVKIFNDAGMEYVGDFSVHWRIAQKLKRLTVERTLKMMPCTKFGKFLNNLGPIGKWIRAQLNVLVWQPEYMLFRKI